MSELTIPASEYLAMKKVAPPMDRMVLIDVRSPAEYAEIHADGAVLLPLDKLESKEVRRLCGDKIDKPVFLICKSGQRAVSAQKLLKDVGFTLPYCIEGGTVAWEQAGLPVVRGTVKVMAMERQVRIAAGLLVVLGLLFNHYVHSAGLVLAGIIGCGLIFSGVTDTCTMGVLLMKMPWNQRTGK